MVDINAHTQNEREDEKNGVIRVAIISQHTRQKKWRFKETMIPY